MRVPATANQFFRRLVEQAPVYVHQRNPAVR
jgi:hypothetical protein